MLEESFLKTNFMGRDGFRWWVGQIPPEGEDYDLQQCQISDIRGETVTGPAFTHEQSQAPVKVEATSE